MIDSATCPGPRLSFDGAADSAREAPEIGFVHAFAIMKEIMAS
jgi:hypothetical protein